MHFKVRRRLGLFWCVPGLLFLCNPVVAFVDVLPDAVGYFLLCIGLRQAADLNGRIEAARDGFRKMLYVSVGALALQYLLYGILPGGEEKMNAYELPVWILLCSFVLLVFQWVFLIPALKELFLGLDVLSRDHTDLRDTDRRGRGRYERLAAFSVRFVVLQSILYCLPELSVLTPFEVEAERLPFDWYTFVNLFRIFAGTAAFLIGAVWLIRSYCVILRFLRDKHLMYALSERYRTEVLPRVGMLTLRRVRASFLLFALGCVFMLVLRVDSVSVFPSYFCGILFCAAAPFLEDFFEKKRVLFFVAACQILCSALQIALCTRYLDHYSSFAHSAFDPDAYVDFLMVRCVQAADAVLTFLLVAVLLRAISRMVHRQVAEIYANDVTASSSRSTARIHRGFDRRILVSVLLCGASAVAKGADALLQLNYPFLWYISGAVTVAAIISVWSLLYAVSDQLEWQYSKDSLNKGAV